MDALCGDAASPFAPRQSADLSLGVPPDYLLSFWDEIVEILYIGYGEFYDLSVPGFEHYSAQGFWHHNSGKSRPLLWEAIFHALEYPGSESIILRKTTPDLKRTVISKFQSDVPEEIYDYYHETDRTVFFNPRPKLDEHGQPMLSPEGTPISVQSKVYFHPCDRDADVNNYLSTEYVYIGFEELGEFSFVIWDAMAGRNRCPIPGSRASMAGATNPFGIGWHWIKKLWVQKQPIAGMDPEKYDPDQYEYIHSTVDDNPIYIRDTEYVQRLEASPNREVVRWGKLDAVSGMYFDNWNVERHERQVSDFIFQSWQPVWVGWDYGFSHWAAMFFFTKAILKPILRTDTPRMVNVTIYELTLQECTPAIQTRAVIDAIPNLCVPDARVESVHLSHERFSRTVGEFTVADEIGNILQEAGLPRPQRANTNRVAGWTKMYSLLEADEWFVLKQQCPTLCEAIPQLPRIQPGKGDIEDVEKPKSVSLYDDCGDACRYGIAGTLLDDEPKPKEQQYEEELAKISDPMARFSRQYREYLEHGKQERQPRREIILPTWRSKLKPK